MYFSWSGSTHSLPLQISMTGLGNYKLFTNAHRSGRVWGPCPIWWYSIWCTHCYHSPNWNKPCVTPEEYLGTTKCAWDSHNGAIPRRSRHPTVDYKEKSFWNSKFLVLALLMWEPRILVHGGWRLEGKSLCTPTFHFYNPSLELNDTCKHTLKNYYPHTVYSWHIGA